MALPAVKKQKLSSLNAHGLDNNRKLFWICQQTTLKFLGLNLVRRCFKSPNGARPFTLSFLIDVKVWTNGVEKNGKPQADNPTFSGRA